MKKQEVARKTRTITRITRPGQKWIQSFHHPNQSFAPPHVLSSIPSWKVVLISNNEFEVFERDRDMIRYTYTLENSKSSEKRLERERLVKKLLQSSKSEIMGAWPRIVMTEIERKWWIQVSFRGWNCCNLVMSESKKLQMMIKFQSLSEGRSPEKGKE